MAMTFDKTKVVPPEYAHVLDQNIKFHFLEGTGITLHTIDDSDFNIVISNNQKIIVKKKQILQRIFFLVQVLYLKIFMETMMTILMCGTMLH